MNIESNGRFQHITPCEGMILTDGDTFSSSVYLPLTADISKWSEVRKEVVNMSAADVAELVEAWNNAETLQARIDELGKIDGGSTAKGNYLNPIEWHSGMFVKAGVLDYTEDGWYVFDGLVQRCIKSGNPESFTDAEYWEVVG